MNSVFRLAVVVVVTTTALIAFAQPDKETSAAVPLPPPNTSGGMSLGEALTQRRSIRSFADTPLALKDLAQLCWAGQGITDQQRGFRTSPSAGALYPIELYMVTADGVRQYLPHEHAARWHTHEDVRAAFQAAALGQDAIGDAPVCFVVAAVPQRSARKYGTRASRYCMIEAGHVAQNILLQATALGLGGVPIGAYDDDAVAKVLKLPDDQSVLYLLPIGRPLE